MTLLASKKRRRAGHLWGLALVILALIAAGATVRTVAAATETPCLLLVRISPEARVAVERGTVAARLRQGDWQSFAVRFDNAAQVTAVPRIVSPNAPPGKDRNHWLDVRLEPQGKRLTGSRREYRTLRVRSRDAGPREATFRIDVGQGTQDLGFRGEVYVLFQCRPRDPAR